MEISEVIKCYYEEYDLREQQSYFLLEDVSNTHSQTDWPVPPTISQCGAAIACLAKIHAYWWKHPRLGEDLLQKCNQGNSWSERNELAVSNIMAFFDFVGDRLSKEREQIYERILSSVNQSWRPQQDRDGVALLHGDAHFWIFLYPCENSSELVRVIDWNSWDIGRATDDLAYMIGLHWYPERRKKYEKILLWNYCTRLEERCIESHWEELWQDYKKSAIMNLFVPIWQWCKGITAAVWWSHLERSFLAYEDLGCESIL